VSETVASLGELLDSAEEVVDGPTSYLVGQLAAELISSASDAELNQMIVAAHQHSGSSDREVTPSARQSILSMLLGLLQGVLADRESAGHTASPLTVRERVLNLLATEPRNPKSLSNEIGCSMATASRALRRLHDSDLVVKTSSPDLADGRYVMYELTEKGQKRQEDRFFGRLPDDDPVSQDIYKDCEYDYCESLARLTDLVADLRKHDPVMASGLYLTLELLKDQVDEPNLRADALSELSRHDHSKLDLESAEQSRGWVEELFLLAQEGNPLIAGRAHYARARWSMRNESTDESGIEDDLTRAQQFAAAAHGPRGADLHAWCVYQRSSWAAVRVDWTHAESLARAATSEFDRLGDHYGRIASQIVAARAQLALREVLAADDMLAEVVESARHFGYKLLIADGLFRQGQAKIWIDDDVARETLEAAVDLYTELGDQDKCAMARASAQMVGFIAGDRTVAAARSLRDELESTSAEIEKATGISSVARSWTVATIYRRIGVVSTVAGDRKLADLAWERAVEEFDASGSAEGIAATLASIWLTNNADPTESFAGVASDLDIRSVAMEWDLNPSERTIGLAVAELSRVPSDPDGRFKGVLTYG